MDDVVVRRRVGHHKLNLMSMYSPMLEVCLICPHAFLLEVYFMHELWLGRRNDSHMMWYEGACLYYVDETFYMFIIVLLLQDPHVDEARRLQSPCCYGCFWVSMVATQ